MGSGIIISEKYGTGISAVIHKNTAGNNASRTIHPEGTAVRGCSVTVKDRIFYSGTALKVNCATKFSRVIGKITICCFTIALK